MKHQTNDRPPPELRCLLCNGASLSVVWSLSGAEVRALWRECGRALTEAAYGGLTPAHAVSQFECGTCGFRFFDPALAGAGNFTRSLNRAAITSGPARNSILPSTSAGVNN